MTGGEGGKEDKMLGVWKVDTQNKCLNTLGGSMGREGIARRVQTV